MMIDFPNKIFEMKLNDEILVGVKTLGCEKYFSYEEN